jgi:cytoskeletal protein RodZ
MSLDFETKKVPIETLGEYLAAVRKHLKLSIDKVSKKTGIYSKFLRSLEQSEFQQLPPDVYVLGFLRKLAKVYAVPEETILEQYRKERGIIEQVTREQTLVERGIRGWLSRVVVTPKLLTLSGGVLVAVIAITYLIVQVSAINRTPHLEVSEPQNDMVIKDSSVTVAGKTEPGTSISINGQNVYVGNDGGFKATLGMATGQKELRVEAHNKFGKTAVQVVSLRVEQQATPEQVAAAAAAEQQDPAKPQLELELKFLRAASITLNRDGIDVPEEIVPARGIKKVTANTKIVLTTPDAGGISATFNGKPIGVLGRKDETVTIPFTVDANLVVKTSDTFTTN